MDRVHPSIPILHQRRYQSWSKSASKTPSRTCLQRAMWTLAALSSTQFRDLADSLYEQTRQVLESVCAEPGGDAYTETELVQAWVLVAISESMRARHRQAWMSAGQAFRLLQASRYHEIDGPGGGGGDVAAEGDDVIVTEEKRRVFWMAYLLDHVFSMRNDWPITLNEHVVRILKYPKETRYHETDTITLPQICTRLPAPDAEFQRGQGTLGGFLSEAMAEPGRKACSPLNECIILATISGRSLFREQQDRIPTAYGEISQTAAQRREWLDESLIKRLEILSRCYPSPMEANDPLLLFANIMAQATIVYSCKGMLGKTSGSDTRQLSDPGIVEYQQRALAAIEAMVRTMKLLSELYYSKVSKTLTRMMIVHDG